MENNRTASYIALFSAPVLFLLGRVVTIPIVGLIALGLGGLMLGIIIAVRSSQDGDVGSRNRASMGAFLSAVYIGMIIYVIFVVLPGLQKNALEIQRQAQQKAAATAPATPAAATPAPAQ